MKHAPYTEKWTVRLVREKSPGGNVAHLGGPMDLVNLFNAMYADSPVEVAVAFYLNTRLRVVGHTLISQGTVDASLIDAGDVFRPAILAVARNIVVAHNHPSGEPSFSPEDVMVARRLAKAGEILSIRLLDFITVTHDGKYASAAEAGLL